jgi:hypothetical protein
MGALEHHALRRKVAQDRSVERRLGIVDLQVQRGLVVGDDKEEIGLLCRSQERGASGENK